MPDPKKLMVIADTEEKVRELLNLTDGTLDGISVALLNLRLTAFMVARHDREIRELQQRLADLAVCVE